MAPRQEAASFVPISPTINIPHLLSTTPNFKPVQRIDARRINPTNLEALQATIHEHVVLKGIPLVIENWHLRADWPKWIFNVDWLRGNHGTDQVNIRDIPNKADVPMTLGHYLNNMGKLASKFSPSNYDGRQQRLYGKDLDCPPVWRSSLANILPESTFYLSPRADLMSSLPKEARAENMMCYIGHEGTYTPAHIEMCATLGHNIMLANSSEGANSEKGSSLWFMTRMDDRDSVAEYWMGTLGHDLAIEAHFASLEDLQQAPFEIYVVEQKVGDYVLVPPLAPHQVWNRGTYTVKAAWNRVTVDTLEHAMRETIPKIRLVCRDEQYKTRAIIYDTLKKYTAALDKGDEAELKTLPPSLKDDYVRLYNLFTDVLLDECFSPLLPKEKNVELITNEYNITCSFCRGNIFNRFLSCKRCPPSQEWLEDDPYDVCMDCYTRGRSCFCVSGFVWVEQHPWVDLLRDHEKFRLTIIKHKNENASEPPQFSQALANLNKERKTLARVCQEALQNRPYLDPDVIDDLDDEKEIAKKKREGKLLACHTCGNRHPNWKAMLCTTKDCGKAYCFGNLWRAYDMDPFDDCLATHYWKCPVCLGFCSCGRCRKKPGATPYVPKGTILGAVTKHVADPRSVESLVDFGKGNVGWLINGVNGAKRKRGADGEEQVGSISQWTQSTGAPDTAEPDTNLAEESVILEEFNDRNIVTLSMGYKAHFGAAGLDVASIPIDPNLKTTGYRYEIPVTKEGNSEYVKIFENPPDVPVSPRRHLKQTQGIRAMISGNAAAGDQERRQILNNPNIDPALAGSIAATDVTVGELGYPSFTQSEIPQIPVANNLSALEKNPLAFLAAAGLVHSQRQEQGLDHTDEWVDPYQNPYEYGGPALHPTETFEPEYDQDAPSEPYGSSAALEPYQLHVDPSVLSNDQSGAKSRKPPLSKKERKDRVQGDLDLEPVRDTGVAEWVKNMKSKKSRRRKGSMVVVLKISPDAWRRHEAHIEKEKEEKVKKLAARFGHDDVGTDLAPDPKRRRLNGTADPSANKKGRPSGSRKGYIEVSDDEDVRVDVNDLLSDDEDTEVLPKKSKRSSRTGDLVDGLTFEPSRRTPLNKSSRPPPSAKKNILSQALGIKSKAIANIEEDASTPLAYDYDDESSTAQSPGYEMLDGQSPARSAATDEGTDGTRNKNLKESESKYKEAVQKALLEAKSTALAAAEGLSPPAYSAYSTAPTSREASETPEESPVGLLVAIEPKARNWDREREEYTPIPIETYKASPLANNSTSSSAKGPKRPLRPSRPLSKPLAKRGRPKMGASTPVKTPSAPSREAGFTPINPNLALKVTSSAKRGRPRQSAVLARRESSGSDTLSTSPLSKKRRKSITSPTKPKDKTKDAPSKPRGRPPKNSIPNTPGSVNQHPSTKLTSLSPAKSLTPKKKPGRPARSSLGASKISNTTSSGTPKAAPTFVDITSLDASRSRNVIELLRHSPAAAEDDDDDWF